MRACILAMLLAGSLVGEQFPRVEGENLLGQKTTLPDAAAGHPTVVVIGFTRASQNQTKSWAASVREDLSTYSVAVLEDAPRLVRGMTVRGMKSGVPEDQREHFVVIYRNEKELKQVAGFDNPDDAYVLLLDKDGAIHWRFHGAVTDAAIEELRSRADLKY
jgi:ATP10 protein